MVSRAECAERFAQRCVARIRRTLVEDCGSTMLSKLHYERLHDVLAEEFLEQLAPDGEAERAVDRGFAAGFQPDE